ncbi:YoaK family protein [Microtetraspora malaysiensis]|uniref:YoaK family protein n=1 Tax=Microtetraspora malaysiensis TaxID=161358 RepID=UPI000834E0C1|nr:YoaK family protein [Microtetraspora malaysiensis]
MTDSQRPGGHRLTLLAVILTVGAGAVDAACFIRLGGVFSSVVTGNLVLLGYAISGLIMDVALRTVVAVGGYISGVAIGTGITGPPKEDMPIWPVKVTMALMLEFACLILFSTGWVLTGGRPDGIVAFALLALAAVAMGLQSAAMRGLGGHAALSTTYLTGTLTGLVAAMLMPRRSGRLDSRGMAILAALTIGAAIGSLLVVNAPPVYPIVPLVMLGSVIAAAVIRRARESADSS